MAVEGYSAQVALTIVVGGLELALSHVSPQGIIVRDDCDPIPPGEATLIVEVDGRQRQTQVFLPSGIAGPGKRVEYF